MSDSQPYNPLDKRNLGASVAEALLSRKPQPLNQLKTFSGAGIYAIYYVGNYSAYESVVARNANDRFEAPIYVGKAVPAGARKGAVDNGSSKSTALYRRLLEHAESIEAVNNLKVGDFFCRYLVVDDIWIPLGESLLITKFAPVWNNLVDGFGNHDPGKGRYNGMRPRWDVLHPGRSWASKCAERQETDAQIASEVQEYLRSTPVPENPHFYAEQKRAGYKK